MAKRRPSLADVAKHAGVSRQTAGMILSGNDTLFRPTTRMQVMESATALAYRPHGSANSMRTGTQGCIALVFDHNPFRSGFSQHMVLALETELSATDRYLALAKLTPNDDLPPMLRRIGADAVVLNYHGVIPAHLEQALARQPGPSVRLNTKLAHDAVYPDDFVGGRDLCAWLLKRGHRRIAWADQAYDSTRLFEVHYSRVDRRRGYEAAMRDAGLPTHFLERSIDADVLPWDEVLFRALAGADRLTAVIGSGSDVIFGGLAAAMRRNLRVPEDVIFCSFEDYPRPDYGFPAPLMIVPWNRITAQAVAMLDRRLAGAGSQPSEAVPLDLLP